MKIPENSELRLYTFVNFYLSSIQQGIQSAHVVHSLFTKYLMLSAAEVQQGAYDTLTRWARDHKTMIVLSGGMNESIWNFHEMFYKLPETLRYPDLPFESFCEDEKSLGGVMTAVGIVLPEQYFNAVRWTDIMTKVDSEVFDEAADDLDMSSYYYAYPEIQKITSRDQLIEYPPGSPDWNLISTVKNCGLAR